MKSKTTAVVLALFLGGLGIHRFYVRNVGLGILYLVFFWTFIPAIAALIDAIVWITWSDEKWNAKYNDEIKRNYVSSDQPAPVASVPQVDADTAKDIELGRATHFYPTLAGFQYHDAPKLAEHLRPGVQLKLVREPDNEYDPKAVRVMYGENKIGYLPRQYANSFAKQIDRGDVIDVSVFRHSPHNDDFEKIQLELIDINFFNRAKRIIKAH